MVVSSQLADRLTAAKLGAAQAAAPLYAQYRHRQYLKAVAKRFPNRTAPAPSLPDATDPIHAILASLPGPIPASCTAVLALQNAFAITTQGSARNKYLHAQCNDHGLRCRYVMAANGTLNLERMRARARVPSLRMGFHMPVWMKPFGARGLSAGTAGEFSLALAHRDVYDSILRERLACALVFENDVLLAPGFVRRLGRLALPDALDVLKLETCNLAAPFRMTRLQA